MGAVPPPHQQGDVNSLMNLQWEEQDAGQQNTEPSGHFAFIFHQISMILALAWIQAYPGAWGLLISKCFKACEFIFFIALFPNKLLSS